MPNWENILVQFACNHFSNFNICNECHGKYKGEKMRKKERERETFWIWLIQNIHVQLKFTYEWYGHFRWHSIISNSQFFVVVVVLILPSLSGYYHVPVLQSNHIDKLFLFTNLIVHFALVIHISMGSKFFFILYSKWTNETKQFKSNRHTNKHTAHLLLHTRHWFLFHF